MSNMKNIFQKNLQLKAPDGNLYEWKAVETIFQVPKKGLYSIKIEASASSAKQNRSTDDDDLRIALDGFDFGKYENHQEKTSWKGFGTAASWNGASLKGGTKIIYYFVVLEKGNHSLQFFADNVPTLKNIEVFAIKDNKFELKNLKPSENIKSAKQGIPWLSFIFLGSHTKSFILGVNTRSAKAKSGTDGDNLKVVVNGKIRKNKQSEASKKYKNFYFSGDLKVFDILTVTNQDSSTPIAFENSIELWYDEEPEISSLDILFFDNREFLESLKSMVDLRSYMTKLVYVIIAYFKIFNKPFSAQFIRHSIEDNASPLIFHSKDDLVKLIKKDPSYSKIVEKLQEKIGNGILEGEIWPKDFKHDKAMKGRVNFDSPDLATALHGIKKIEYRAEQKGNNKFEVKFILFDIYDFQKEDVPPLFSGTGQALKQKIVNELDMGEDLEIIHNFEIEIDITQILYVN